MAIWVVPSRVVRVAPAAGGGPAVGPRVGIGVGPGTTVAFPVPPVLRTWGDGWPRETKTRPATQTASTARALIDTTRTVAAMRQPDTGFRAGAARTSSAGGRAAGCGGD